MDIICDRFDFEIKAVLIYNPKLLPLSKKPLEEEY
jgi:hypothetical protein